MTQAETNESEMQLAMYQAQSFMSTLASTGASPAFVIEEGYKFIFAYLRTETFMKSQDMSTAAQFVELCAKKIGIHPDQLEQIRRMSKRE